MFTKDYEWFKGEIYKLTQIDLNAYKEKQMKRRLLSLISKKRLKDFEEYITLLKKDQNALEEFLSYMTINVSEFYRNPNQWEVLEREIVPLLKNKSSVRVWSAACSTGQEPYSLAMMLSQYMPLNQIEIIATDLDELVLNKAKEGSYDIKIIQGIPDKMRKKFLVSSDKGVTMHDSLKKSITFKKHDLLKDAYPKNVDLIVCRNVLIYFTEEAKKNIYTKFHQSLKNDGVLFVGSTEQIINAPHYGFNSLRTFFYQKSVK